MTSLCADRVVELLLFLFPAFLTALGVIPVFDSFVLTLLLQCVAKCKEWASEWGRPQKGSAEYRIPDIHSSSPRMVRHWPFPIGSRIQLSIAATCGDGTVASDQGLSLVHLLC